MSKANVVIAGDEVHAGIDDEDRSVCKNAIVIQFESAEEMGKALRDRNVAFSVFEPK